ncbi:MAG: hypothetical protein VX833_04685 [Actinomycetota bacterium]|nr:hypothetical protein [Actinomycetota bacterium]
MLLRASSDATDGHADLTSAVGEGRGDGVDHGRVLLQYAEAANQVSPEIASLSDEVLDAFGLIGLVEAAATVSVFNGLVRSADAIGIPLDGVVLNATAEQRSILGIDEYAGAAQSRADGA